MRVDAKTLHMAKPNNVKDKLRRGEVSLGMFLLSGNSMVAEACATTGLDWLMVDAEAAPISREATLHMLQAMTGRGVEAMIRVQWLERHLVEHALDIGASAVLVPKVDTADEARAAVQASKFPPAGRRGVNPVRASGYFADVAGYIAAANDATMCMVQIESVESVANARAIAQVSGIDVLFIGAGDLACALGQPGNVVGPKMDSARGTVLDAAAWSGKVPGIFAYGIDLARQYAAEGFKFIAIGNDIKALKQGISADLLAFHASADGV